MKKNLLTAFIIIAIGATLLTGCGQAEEGKAAEAVTQTVEENTETKKETVEETNAVVETESVETENVENKTEEKDAILNGADLIVPGDSGYTYTVSTKYSIDYEGELFEDSYANIVKFDGTKYYGETLEGSDKGSTEFCDITDGYFRYHTIMDGEDLGWDSSSYGDFKSYEDIKEKDNRYFEKLKDNTWVYVDEEEGNLIYSSSNSKSIQNDTFVEGNYVRERFYDVEQTIYINAETKELIKLVEKFKLENPSYNYDDSTGEITGIDKTFVYDYYNEYEISDIGTTTVQAPEGVPE